MSFQILYVSAPVGEPKLKAPFFRTTEFNINPGDFVLVRLTSGFHVAEVKDTYIGDIDEKSHLPWIIQKVDTTSHDENMRVEAWN